MSTSIGSAQDIAVRLREEIDRLGGISPIARQIGVHRNTAASWCQTGAISTTDLNKLAEVGVDAMYVAFGKRVMEPVKRQAIPSPSTLGMRWIEEVQHTNDGGLRIKGRDEDGAVVDIAVPPATGASLVQDSAPNLYLNEYALVPFYDLAASAGHGRAVIDTPGLNHKRLAYLREWLHARNLTASNLFEISVAGDSMESELRDGDTVLVDRSQTEIRGGAIYVLSIGSELVIKYLQRLPGGRIQVSSENRDAYPAYEVTQQEIDSGEVEVLGRVVRQGRDR